MMSTQRAIWAYWRDVLYAWAGATTLDFAPLFFMVLLAVAYDRQQSESLSASLVGDAEGLERPRILGRVVP
jgi:hypothetical protein